MEQAKAKTATRIETRKKFLALLLEQLETAKTATEELEVKHRSCHEERAEAHAVREEKVRAAFQDKLLELRAAKDAKEAAEKKAKEEEERKRKQQQTAQGGDAQVPQDQRVAQTTQAEASTTAESSTERQLAAFQQQLQQQLADSATNAALVQQKHMEELQRIQRQLEEQGAGMRRTQQAAKLEQERMDAYTQVREVDPDKLPILSTPQGEQFQKQG